MSLLNNLLNFPILTLLDKNYYFACFVIGCNKIILKLYDITKGLLYTKVKLSRILMANI